MVYILFLYVFFIFLSISIFLISLIKETHQFKRDTYILLTKLNDMFDIADDNLIKNLNINRINEEISSNK